MYNVVLAVKQCMKRNTGFLKSKNKPNGEEDLDRFLSSTFKLPQKLLIPLAAVRTPSSCHSVFDECGHENACHDIAKDLARRSLVGKEKYIEIQKHTVQSVCDE